MISDTLRVQLDSQHKEGTKDSNRLIGNFGLQDSAAAAELKPFCGWVERAQVGQECNEVLHCCSIFASDC